MTPDNREYVYPAPTDAQTNATDAQIEANRAQRAANQAAANADAAAADADPGTHLIGPWYLKRSDAPTAATIDRPTVRYVADDDTDRKRALGCLGLIGVAGLLGTCAIASSPQLANQVKGILNQPLIPSGNTSTLGGEFACSPASDLGGFHGGTTVDTTGKGGAIVDDTIPGQTTQVAVVPPNTKVHFKGDVHEWLYNTDCTMSQITTQAQDHAAAAGAQYIPDYHNVNGIGQTNGNQVLLDRIHAQQEALASQPVTKKAVRLIGRKLGKAV